MWWLNSGYNWGWAWIWLCIPFFKIHSEDDGFEQYKPILELDFLDIKSTQEIDNR